jgi:hypothetical protein
VDDLSPMPRPDEHDALLEARPQLVDLLAVLAGRRRRAPSEKKNLPSDTAPI